MDYESQSFCFKQQQNIQEPDQWQTFTLRTQERAQAWLQHHSHVLVAEINMEKFGKDKTVNAEMSIFTLSG